MISRLTASVSCPTLISLPGWAGKRWKSRTACSPTTVSAIYQACALCLAPQSRPTTPVTQRSRTSRLSSQRPRMHHCANGCNILYAASLRNRTVLTTNNAKRLKQKDGLGPGVDGPFYGKDDDCNRQLAFFRQLQFLSQTSDWASTGQRRLLLGVEVSRSRI